MSTLIYLTDLVSTLRPYRINSTFMNNFYVIAKTNLYEDSCLLAISCGNPDSLLFIVSEKACHVIQDTS